MNLSLVVRRIAARGFGLACTAFLAMQTVAAVACVPLIRVAQAGETKEAFEARSVAEDEETERYASASPSERAVIDQAKWIDSHAFVFVARVKPTPIAQAYMADANANPGGDEILVTPPIEYLLRGPHRIGLEPVAWIKGHNTEIAGWQWVGGRSVGDCSPNYPFDLDRAKGGELMVVFANPFMLAAPSSGPQQSIRQFQLFGIRAETAAEPSIVSAVKAAEGLAL